MKKEELINGKENSSSRIEHTGARNVAEGVRIHVPVICIASWILKLPVLIPLQQSFSQS